MAKLAIFGGNPIISNHQTLLSKWPLVSNTDIADICNIMHERQFSGRNSNIITAFEEEISLFLNVKHTSLFNSGTASLQAEIVAA